MNRFYKEVDARASRADHAEGVARRALLAGVILGAALLLAGMSVLLLERAPCPDVPPDRWAALRGISRLEGVALLYVGLLVLAATPILRVIVMTWVYLRRREWFMLAVSVIVLLLLSLGVLLGTG